MARIYHPEVARGGIGFAKVSAPSDCRYVGLYHWCGYWRHWDKIIATDDGWWTVQTVSVDGEPLSGTDGRIRKHCTPMEACHFADKPFHVRGRYGEGAIVGNA